MTMTVKELIAELSTFDPELEVMVGTAYDNGTELTSAFSAYETSANNIEGDFYMEVDEDDEEDTPEKKIVAIW